MLHIVREGTILPGRKHGEDQVWGQTLRKLPSQDGIESNLPASSPSFPASSATHGASQAWPLGELQQSPKRVHQVQVIISSHMKLLPLKASSGKTLQNCLPLLLNRTILNLFSFILGHLPTPCSTKDPQVGHAGSHLTEGAGLCLNQTQKLGAHPLQVHSTPPAHLASLPALGTDDMDKGNTGEVGSK